MLTRRTGESIIIAGDIKITIVSVGPDRVKLGIESPPHVPVDRQEIYDARNQPGASDLTNVPAAADTGTPAGAPTSFRLVIEAHANMQLDASEVADHLVRLCEKLDEYCRLKYGRGLTLREFEQYVRVASPVPVGG